MKKCLVLMSLILSVLSTTSAFAQKGPFSPSVTWCQKMPPLSDATARGTIVYGFDLDQQGKPFNIKRTIAPSFFTDDKLLTDCIAAWRVPTGGRKATATFWFQSGSWTRIRVYAGGDQVDLLPDSPKPPASQNQPPGD